MNNMNNELDFDLEQNRTPDSKRIKNLSFKIPRKARIILSLLLFTAIVIALMSLFKPQAEKRSIPEIIVKVDVIQATRSNYPILVNSNGTIEADTRGDLIAQVRGEIVHVSDNFKAGGIFKKDDVLLEIDQRDYHAQLSQSLASLSQSEAAYRQEQANAKQAKKDWKRLGNTGSATDLVLRKPQLIAAKAAWDSAKASSQMAEINLSHTKITAPYTGRVIRRDAALGQYVSVGSKIAEIFETSGIEVRLPISQEEFNQLGLDQLDAKNGFDVVLSNKIGNTQYTWNAKITRTDSTFDLNTRQIDVIAVLPDSFSKDGKSSENGGKPPLRIGQFVQARIQGRTLDNVFVLPNKSLHEGSFIYIAKNGLLHKQIVDVLWQDDQNAIIENGITEGDLVVTTSLNSTLVGARVKLTKEFSETAKATKTTTDQLEPPISAAESSSTKISKTKVSSKPTTTP